MDTDYSDLTLEEMRDVRDALAQIAAVDDDFLSLFESADAHVERMEAQARDLSPVEKARLKLKQRKG